MGSPTSDGSFFSEIGLGAAQQTNWQNLVTEATTANTEAQAAITTVNASVATASAAATGASASAATATGAATTATTQAGTATTAATTATGAATTATAQATNASASATAAAASAASAAAANSGGGNNKLINPFMEIDQANEGALVSSIGATFVIDGWSGQEASAHGAVVSAQRVTDAPPGYPNSVKLTVTTPTSSVGTSDYLMVQQNIEADNLIDTAFGTSGALSVAITVWLKASIAGTYACAIRNYASTRAYPFLLVLSAANTWQKFTQVVPGDTAGTWVTSGNAGGLSFDVVAVAGTVAQGTANTWNAASVWAAPGMTNTITTTSGATFQVGPCKLEVSANPTPLVRTSIAEELAKCQRYYEKSYDIGVTVGAVTTAGAANTVVTMSSATITSISVHAAFKVNKRTTPTITEFSPATGTSGKVRDAGNSADVVGTVVSAGTTSCVFQTTLSAANTAGNVQAHWTADARL